MSSCIFKKGKTPLLVITLIPQHLPFKILKVLVHFSPLVFSVTIKEAEATLTLCLLSLSVSAEWMLIELYFI